MVRYTILFGLAFSLIFLWDILARFTALHDNNEFLVILTIVTLYITSLILFELVIRTEKIIKQYQQI